MNCIASGIFGIAMLTASFATMSVSEEQQKYLKRKFSPRLNKIYCNIVKERRNLYLQGLLLGLVFGYFLSKVVHTTNHFHRTTLIVGVGLAVSVIYYFLMPKSDYMLNHLESVRQNKAWMKVYTTMKQRYFLGLVFGIIAAIPLSYAVC